MVYEVATFQALREQLRCKEVWVVGAGRWRNPDEDLPKDFEARRVEHYGELRKPLDPAVFITSLREEMTEALADLDEALPELDWAEIKERKAGAIKFTAPEASEEPRNLRRVKNEVGRRWNAVPLIDMLKEAVLRTGCLKAVTSVAGSGHLAPEVLAERLMLAIYAYGTNAGIRSVAGGAHGHTEEEIRYVRRRYLTSESARRIAVEIANATFAARYRVVGQWVDGGGVGFVARYLRDRDLQREIEEGLNVVESWNAANAVIYYGKGGEISTGSAAQGTGWARVRWCRWRWGGGRGAIRACRRSGVRRGGRGR
ncbi:MULTISPECIES: Tn3 family transposase [Protofrankia]|uniref:Tn3 family transposase n=1 Tax=Protofrankia TaxID=2994361 RepID=UPI0001C533B7|nr:MULTISPECIES: Tn3 family transposase [Protofrankia]